MRGAGGRLLKSRPRSPGPGPLKKKTKIINGFSCTTVSIILYTIFIMIIQTNKPDRESVKYLHEFDSSVKVEYYFITEPPFGVPAIAWYICTADGITGLYNNKGEYIYEVGSMDPGQVLCRIEERSFYNYKLYGKARPLHIEQPINGGESWSKECLRKCGGNIILYLTKEHPKRTIQECESVMANEGYRINKITGFLEPIEGLKQL